MIFAKQLRMFRSAENMNRSEMALLSGLSEKGIQNIEEGSNYSDRSYRKILRVIEGRGYLLTENGIEERTKTFTVVNDFTDVLTDARSCLRKGQDIYFHCADDRRSDETVTRDLQKLEEEGYKLHFTYERGNSFFTTSPSNYRWIDPEYFANSEVEVVYADRYVIQVGNDEDVKFQIIKNSANAEARKRQIQYFWNKGELCRDLDT